VIIIVVYASRRVHSVIRSEGRAEVQTLNHKEGAEPEDCRADRMRRVSHSIHERREEDVLAWGSCDSAATSINHNVIHSSKPLASRGEVHEAPCVDDLYLQR